MKNSIRFFIVALCTISFYKVHAYTQVLIDEVMYDTKGADAGHEWVEIYNSGSTSVNLTQWKLFENDKNHGIKSYKGSDMFAAGAYAVIANNGDMFMKDHPNFAGQIFSSSFSLSNDGETIGLKDENANELHKVFYSKDAGAAGDGNSLQKIDSVWHVAYPTPGESNSLKSTQALPPSAPDLSSMGDILSVQGETIAGEMLTFITVSGSGAGTWNFGDGTTLEKKDLEPAQHRFAFAGTYIVIQSSADGEVVGHATVTIDEKTGLTETIVVERARANAAAPETIVASKKDRTSPETVSLDASSLTARASRDEVSMLYLWIALCLCALTAGAVGVRMYKNKKQEDAMPDTDIEIIE